MPTRLRPILWILICASLAGCQWLQRPSAATMRADVINNAWTGTDSEGDHYEFHFQSDGSLHYTSPAGSYTNGTWKLDGSSIYFEINQRYSEYKGTLSKDEMSGEASNRQGKKWKWSIRKPPATNVAKPSS